MSAQAYASSREHLVDELHRIDQLVRAETARWRLAIAQNKPEELWGMVHVSDKEIDGYMLAPFNSPWEEAAAVTSVTELHRLAAGELASTIAQRIDATGAVPLRLLLLQRMFGLRQIDLDILLIAMLPELDCRYRRLYGYLQDDASRTKPVVELVSRIASGDPAEGRGAFEAGQPLVRHRLVSMLDERVDEPVSMRSVRVDDRIAAFLLDSDAPDAALQGVVSRAAPLALDDLVAEPMHRQRLQRLAAALKERHAVVFVHGPYGVGKLATARAICDAQKRPLLVADVGAGLRAAGGWERTVDLAFREARLLGSAIQWRGVHALMERDQPAHRLDYLAAAAERFPGQVFLASETAWDPSGRFLERPIVRIDLAVPAYRERVELWRRMLPDAAAFAEPALDRRVLVDTLANGFQFTAGQVLDAISTARGLATRRDPLQPQLTGDDFYEGCRRHSSRRLISFSRRIEPRTELTFDDLILPAPNKRQLQELRDRLRNRGRVYTDLGFERRLTLGRGLIVLFSGSSGTGKTMAAELLAREQRVDLFKVDLSAVVSKYVGETEKNLSRVFEEAEYSNAIIFFDEADALFGKRGEVKEAQDRWANIEVNYLLQRVEEYSGIVILASNLRQNIDEAFHRRIHIVVEFPSPDAAARLKIWRGLFPPGIGRPSDDEIQDLADRFRLPGGSIRNIVLDSAFRAIGEANGHGVHITAKHVVLSAAREYQKLGKPITRGEFDSTYYSWVEDGLMQR